MSLRLFKKIYHGRAPCSGCRGFLVWMLLLYLPAACIPLLYLSGCATSPISDPYHISIDQFPEFMNQDGSRINPASIDSSIPDVDVLSLNEEIKAILDGSVAGIKNSGQRLKALVDIISKKVKYNTQDDRFGTKTAIETYESGTGNCLSFVNLFISMARYVKLDSGYQDIRTPPNWIKNGEALFVTRHIGAYVNYEIPVQGSYVLDLSGNKSIVVMDIKKSVFIAPSLDAEGPEVGSYSTGPIPDRMAFAQYYNNIASQYLAAGDVAGAYRYFIKAIKTDPNLSFIWSNLGVAYLRNNQDDAAEKAYLHAFLINKGKDEISEMTIMSNMARLYSKTGEKERAVFYEKEVASFRDKNPYYNFFKGKAAFSDGFYEESVRQFKEAIRKKDDEHLFHYALGLSYIKLEDYSDAERSLKKAISYTGDEIIKDFYKQVLDNLLKSEADLQKPTG